MLGGGAGTSLNVFHCLFQMMRVAVVVLLAAAAAVVVARPEAEAEAEADAKPAAEAEAEAEADPKAGYLPHHRPRCYPKTHYVTDYRTQVQKVSEHKPDCYCFDAQ